MKLKKELEEALSTDINNRTLRQHNIVSMHNILIDPLNSGKNRTEILELEFLKCIRYRKRSLISAREYRDKVSIIEGFLFD